MEFNVTLVSTKNFILIGIIGIFIVLTSIIITSVFKDLQPFLSIGIIAAGGLTIYFLNKKFSRYSVTVIVNHEYIKVGEKYTIYWNSIKSYEYSDTGLMIGFIFATADKTFTITSFKKGPDGEKFKLIKDSIYKIINERESDPRKGTIQPYNYNNTKAGRISLYVSLTICLIADLLVAYLLITSNKKLKPKIVFDIVILVFITILLIARVYINRKNSANN